MNQQNALLTVDQMSQADRLASDSGVSAQELMANAGQAVVREIESRWSIRPIVVLCGPGNNGGDGFVVARLLAQHGWPVRVAMMGSRERMTTEARYHTDQWEGEIEPIATDVLDGAQLVVDAIFGAGFVPSRENPTSTIFAEIARRSLTMIAVDVPSGVVGDTGNVLTPATAALTVTFFRKKPCHLLMPSKSHCGEIVVADIGIPSVVLDTITPDTFENDPSLWLSKWPQQRHDSNKYDRGHAVVYGGYPMTGAARLSAIAAARIGAGLTTIVVPEIAFPIYAASMTSIMVKPLTSQDTFRKTIQDKRFTAFLIGPGAGVCETTRRDTLTLLKTKRATVIDADAITAFQDNPSDLDRAIDGPCVLTPHDGEFARIFDPSGDKLTRARRAANRSGAVVILKGPDTVIACPSGKCVINGNAPSSLATAGSGDVLSGILTGLLAQGMDTFEAACAAVWIHSEAARLFGPGLIADDLPDMIPRVLGSAQRS